MADIFFRISDRHFLRDLADRHQSGTYEGEKKLYVRRGLSAPPG